MRFLIATHPTPKANEATCPYGLSHSKIIFVQRTSYAPSPTLKSFRTKKGKESLSSRSSVSSMTNQTQPACDFVLRLLLGAFVFPIIFSPF
jgi:hypothetical protein